MHSSHGPARHGARRQRGTHHPAAHLPPAAATHSACCAAEAGSLWREEKLRDFAFRLKCLGLADDPQFAALAGQIAEETQALEQLAERQAQPDYQRPWWQYCEYDSSRADRLVLYHNNKLCTAFLRCSTSFGQHIIPQP